jgi:hypothetical protein
MPTKIENTGKTTFDDWFEVVKEYSRLRLTRESDRLVALMGVATVFQASLQCGYLAGLWLNDIARGLLWVVTRYQSVDSARKPRRPQEAFAPSWSWASLMLNGESSIIFPAAHDDTFRVEDRFEYLGTKIALEVADSNLGATNSREILIRAVTAPAILFHHRKDDPQGQETTLIFDTDVDDAVMIYSLGLHLDVPWTTVDLPFVKDGDTVKCLLIGTMEENDWESVHQDKYFSTLIVKSSYLRKEEYERIGVLDIRQGLGVFQEAREESFKLV